MLGLIGRLLERHPLLFSIGMNCNGAIAFTAGRAAISSTSSMVRPLRRRHSSSSTYSPGAWGRMKMVDEPRVDSCRAIEAFRPATIELMPVTVMIPITTPRMVRKARIL